MSSASTADVSEAGMRLVEAARERDLALRLLGGAAVSLHCPGRDPALARPLADLDVAVSSKRLSGIDELFAELGYTPRVEFNSLNARERLIFDDPANQRHVDVFVGEFKMCHRIPLEARLLDDDQTVPLAELLLTKLQIYEANTKDLQDTAALLAEHPIGHGDDETINADQLERMLGADWGLYATVERTLRATARFAAEMPPAVSASVEGRVSELMALMDAAPKSRGWKMRARVGHRVRWYDLPEEP